MKGSRKLTEMHLDLSGSSGDEIPEIESMELQPRRRRSRRQRLFEHFPFFNQGRSNNHIDAQEQPTLRVDVPRGEILPSLETDEPEIEIIESCPAKYCILPKLSSKASYATRHPLPMDDKDAKVIWDGNKDEYGVDFDKACYPASSLPISRPRYYVRTPDRLGYAFPSLDENSTDEMKQRLEWYKTDKTMTQCLQEFKQRSSYRTNKLREQPEQLVNTRNKQSVYDDNPAIFYTLPKPFRYIWMRDLQKLTEYFNLPGRHEKINRRDELNRTALHLAASWADSKAIRILLSVPGLKVNIKDREEKTPLVKAIEANSLLCVKLLVEAGANLKTLVPYPAEFPFRSANGKANLLQYAICKYGDACSFIVGYLYEMCVVRGLENLTKNLLHLIAIRNDGPSKEQTLKVLLERGADVQTADDEGNIPLKLALDNSNTEIVTILLAEQSLKQVSYDLLAEYVNPPAISSPSDAEYEGPYLTPSPLITEYDPEVLDYDRGHKNGFLNATRYELLI